MRIVTLGPKGTFSEEAALLYQQRSGACDRETEIGFDTILGCFEGGKDCITGREYGGWNYRFNL